MIRVTVDRDRCVGSGNCLFWAPGTFELDDEGTAVGTDPPGDDEERILVAADGCPTRAISVERATRPLDEDEDEEGRGADRTDG